MISHSMSEHAKSLTCTDPGAWTQIGMSENTHVLYNDYD